jgi:hypothetical protein
MQSLQLHLTGAARSWLNTLPNDSIGSWGELEIQFARNFRSTYKCPASLEEIKSCVQKKGDVVDIPNGYISDVVSYRQTRVAHGGGMADSQPGGLVAGGMAD